METYFGVKTRLEIANDYGIEVRTLYRWLKKAGIDLPPGLVKPIHLQLIYEKFGHPKSNGVT